MTGIICINKCKGITSFGVVAKVRGIVGEKKAGHTGTLDPDAEGVLPVMLGGATRFLDYIPDSAKGYRASFVLGKTTDTLDISGTVTAEYDVCCTLSDVENVLEKFTGSIKQIPPMYSAVSINGQRLYKLARQGIEVEREERTVEIKSLSLVRQECNEDKNKYTIDVSCSKGTYIRTLINDIGIALDCGAVMTSLVRTKASGFSLDDCVTLDELQRRKDENFGFSDIIMSVERITEPYDSVRISQAQSKRFQNGGALDLNRIKKPLSSGLYRVYSFDGNFLGLGECDTQKQELKVKRLLVKRD